MRILKAEYPRFPESSLSSLGKSGPKARPKGVVDGQLVEIPVLHMNRTVGTQGESRSAEWKNACKRRRRVIGKSVT